MRKCSPKDFNKMVSSNSNHLTLKIPQKHTDGFPKSVCPSNDVVDEKELDDEEEEEEKEDAPVATMVVRKLPQKLMCKIYGLNL